MLGYPPVEYCVRKGYFVSQNVCMGGRVFPCFGSNTIWIDLYFSVFGAGDRVGGTVPRTVAKLRC